MKKISALLTLMVLNAKATEAWACSVCYGNVEGAFADAVNAGILTLVGFIVFVLSCCAVFFIKLGRRSARMAAVCIEEKRT